MIHALKRSLDVGLQWLLIGLMILLTVIVMLAVIYRKFGSSLVWYDEVASVLMAWITYYGAALAALRRQHIGFDGVLLRLPPKARLVAVLVGEAVVIGFFALLAWMGIKVLAVIGDEGRISLPWVPATFTQSVIPISAMLFIICELLSLPEYLRKIMAGEGGHGPGEAHSADAHGA